MLPSLLNNDPGINSVRGAPQAAGPSYAAPQIQLKFAANAFLGEKYEDDAYLEGEIQKSRESRQEGTKSRKGQGRRETKEVHK